MSRLLTREELRRAIIEEKGGRLGKSTFDKLCSPAIGEGPPVAAWSGRFPLYHRGPGLAWYDGRLTSTRRLRNHLDPKSDGHSEE
jgi:hypothetical protein